MDNTPTLLDKEKYFSDWSDYSQVAFSQWFMGELKRIARNESVGHCTTLTTPWGRFELIFSETADGV